MAETTYILKIRRTQYYMSRKIPEEKVVQTTPLTFLSKNPTYEIWTFGEERTIVYKTIFEQGARHFFCVKEICNTTYRTLIETDWCLYYSEIEVQSDYDFIEDTTYEFWGESAFDERSKESFVREDILYEGNNFVGY